MDATVNRQYHPFGNWEVMTIAGPSNSLTQGVQQRTGQAYGQWHSALWCAARPNTYPFLMRILYSKIARKRRFLEQTGAEASRWCQTRTKPVGQALIDLTGCDEHRDLRDVYANEFQFADRAVANCPQQMGGPGHLDFLYAIAESLQADNVVETGVAYGWSSLALLLSLQHRSNARLISTNLHYRRYEDDDSYVGCAVPDHLRAGWKILRQCDEVALPQALNELKSIDLAHYDSDKSYAGRMFAYSLLWKHLRVGGILVSDDIGDNICFTHFCKMARTAPVIVSAPSDSGPKYIGALVKQDDRPLRDLMF